ncbi:MAG: hypothetical protein ACLQBA_09430 [Candidatus Binataceae bacterium]
MRKRAKSWKLVVLFAAAAIVSPCFVAQSKAFTLIETQLLPAVQLVASQTLLVKVSNVSLDPVEVTVTLYGHSGNVLQTSNNLSLAAGATFSVSYVHPSTTAASDVRGVVTLDTANATVSSIMTLDKTSGEVIAILPFMLLP